QPRRGFHSLCYVGASDACGDLQKIKAAVIAPLDKLGVSDSPQKPELVDHFAVDSIERLRIRGLARDSTRREDAAMRDIHRRMPVLVMHRKNGLPVCDDGIYVIDVTRLILLQYVERLTIAERVKQ